MRYVPIILVLICSEYFLYLFSQFETDYTTTIVKGVLVAIVQTFLLGFAMSLSKND